MLIDYPEAKRSIQKLIDERMQRALLHPIFDGNGIRIMHEGDRFSINGERGWKHAGHFQEASAKFEIDLKEYPSLTLDELLEKVDEATAELLAQKSKMIFESLDKVTAETGNVINVQGALSPEHFFEMIEKVELAFDQDGKPKMGMVAGAGAHAKIISLIQMIEADASLKRRMDDLMERKKDAWRSRESSRALVG